ncbi:MAG TPA: hypothetical protein VNO21_21490, partial [Polyangiaceae bacterium]|nr:hypothetical protein [Polyangiaceae bacterium]
MKDEYTLLKRRLDFMPNAEAAFLDLYARRHHAFWLDSSLLAEGLSRFSFMGAVDDEHGMIVQYQSSPRRLEVRNGWRTTTTTESVFSYLQRSLRERHVDSGDLPFDFNCGFVGYFGYELKSECGGDPGHSGKLPDAAFLF